MNRGISWAILLLGLLLLLLGLEPWWTKHDATFLAIIAWPAAFLMAGGLLALQWGAYAATYTACGCDHCGQCKHGWCCGLCDCVPPEGASSPGPRGANR